VFANSGDGSGARHLVAVKAGGKGDVTQTNLAWEWKKPQPYPYVPCLLTLGDHLYFVSDNGEVGCVVAKTGEMVWKEPLNPRSRGRRTMIASPILVGGNIYATSEDGTTYVYPATTSFKLLAKNPIGEPVMATPAVADNRLFIRGKTHLYCIGKAADKRATQP
jgi:outer membrane protein assembly factor BamB